MKLSFPVAIVLALLANLVPTLGKVVASQQPSSNDSQPTPK